jgi:hypothetical protein
VAQIDPLDTQMTYSWTSSVEELTKRINDLDRFVNDLEDRILELEMDR